MTGEPVKWLSDHERGCAGRDYTCTCGYGDQQDAEVERLREALRECRRAVAGGRDEPRRTVREIVDEAIEGHARATLKAKP